MPDDPVVKCPHCDKELPAVIVSKLKDQTRLSFEIKQEPGYRLSAGTIGGLLADNEKLFQALAKQHGTSMTVLVDNICMSGDKTKIDFILAIPARREKKKRGER